MACGLATSVSLFRGLCIWKGSDLASWGGHSALKSGSLGMNHRRARLVSRSFLFQPVGCKDVKSPGLLCCTGCYWLLLLKKKKQSGSLLKKLLFGGKSASTSDRKGVSNGRRRRWAVFSWSHLVVLRCKCRSWSCLPVG